VNRLPLEDPAERLLGRVLRRQAEAIPDAPFLLSGDDRLSYGEVNARANGAAAGFAELGIGRGGGVALLLPSTPAAVFTALGVNKLGGIWIPINPDYKGAWLRESLEDSRARVLVADAELLPRLAEVAPLPFERVLLRGGRGDEGRALGAPVEPFEFLDRPGAAEPDDGDLHTGDTASVLFTSGTTGRAKGVMQSHNVWIRGALSGADSTGVREGDVLYNVLPVYQSGAWVANLFRALVCGVPCAMDPHFSATQFWDRCRHYGATMIFTLGAMHIFLWRAPERPDDADNPVRVASLIPMPAELEEPFKKRFGIEAISQGYGQSEVMTLLVRNPGRSYKPNALGEVAPGIELKLLDDEDREVPPGEPGEICVRPLEPFVIFNGYWHDDGATVRAWRNLWYHTGDLARRDADGDYFFHDRKQDFIRHKGRNVSSFQVEAALGAHPAVAQVAVHGVPSEELEAEAEIKACVVLAPGATATPEELARFVNDTAPYFFVPRYIEFLDELPMTPTGRVRKFLLRERGVTRTTWDARAAGFRVRRWPGGRPGAPA